MQRRIFKNVLFSRSIRLIPHGIPTKPPGSELNDAGFSQRRVMAGLRSVDRRIARPRDERSPTDVYMLPVLDALRKRGRQSGIVILTALPQPCHKATNSRP
jgi:hypothetical protein